jgi:SSS family solute:Na+ symporter
MSPAVQEALGRTNFAALDWGIVVVYLAISVVIGLLVRRYVHNMADYVSAGRKVGTALGVATLTGTEMGLITVMYSSQLGFTNGFSAFHIALIHGAVTFLVGASGLIIYRLREARVITIPEYYGRRYGRGVRVFGGIMLTLGGMLNMGLFLKAGAMFIVGVTGMDPAAVNIVMTALLALVLVYTVLGGMVAVVITDYIQFVVLSVGLLIASLLCIKTLGWANIFDTVAATKGAAGFNPLIQKGGFGVGYMTWQGFLGLVGCALWPTAVARALAANSPKTVKKQFMWGSVSYTIRFLIPYFLGISAFVLIMSGAPDLKELFFPAAEGAEPALESLYGMPVALGRLLPTGLLGIICAAMIAAFMSTHDSYLLCWSSVITQDIVAPLRRGEMSTKGRILLTRVLVVLVGLWVLAWGIFYPAGGKLWDYMGVTGGIYFNAAFALLVGGLYWKRASRTGAYLALLASFTNVIGLPPVKAAMGLAMGPERVWLMTFLTTVAAMIVGSLLFPDGREAGSSTADSPTDEQRGA